MPVEGRPSVKLLGKPEGKNFIYTETEKNLNFVTALFQIHRFVDFKCNNFPSSG
jgi:hypothetical protein